MALSHRIHEILKSPANCSAAVDEPRQVIGHFLANNGSMGESMSDKAGQVAEKQ
jgi:hypothetical protein